MGSIQDISIEDTARNVVNTAHRLAETGFVSKVKDTVNICNKWLFMCLFEFIYFAATENLMAKRIWHAGNVYTIVTMNIFF